MASNFLDDVPQTADARQLVRVYERAFGPFVHMSTEEKVIWTRWLMRGGTQYAPFTYDIRVGDGLQMPPDSTRFAISAAYALTTKRIDAMYQLPDACVIVEVKRRAGLSAVGQLIGYRDLVLAGPNPPRHVDMLLVTDELQPDVARVLDSLGIHWDIV